MSRRSRPSLGVDIGIAALLLVIDVLIIGWLLYVVGVTGWADGASPGQEPDVPKVVQRAVWFCSGAALISGAGLLALRCRISGITQLIVLGGTAVVLNAAP